jgi:hypothetical protein
MVMVMMGMAGTKVGELKCRIHQPAGLVVGIH